MWQIVSTLKNGKLCRDIKKTSESETKKTSSVNADVLNRMWLHFFLLYFRQLWGNDWKTSESAKWFLLFNYNFYYYQKKKWSLNRKLIRNFVVYSVWKMPSGFFDVLELLKKLSPVSRGLKDPCVPQVCLLPVLTSSLCLKVHHLLFMSSVFLPSFFCSTALDLKHCRGWERNCWVSLTSNLMRNRGSVIWMHQTCCMQVRLVNVKVTLLCGIACDKIEKKKPDLGCALSWESRLTRNLHSATTSLFLITYLKG